MTAVIFIIFTVNIIVGILNSKIISNNIDRFELTTPQKIMIFAAHQDDAVIEAGGVAIQNVNLGGSVVVVYLTIPPDPKWANIRKKEVHNAWQLLSESNVDIFFLDFDSYKYQPWSEEQRKTAKIKISEIIDRFSPNIVVVPLIEKGHIDHDFLSILVAEVILENGNGNDLEILNAAEYNPYYIMGNTPEKVLWFLVRLMPFIDYKSPNYGFIPERQKQLNMSQSDLDLKINMLLQFKSQKQIIPISQFGYPDLFENTFEVPSRVVKVGGKYFSLWSLFTISLTLILFLMIGLNINNLLYMSKKYHLFISLLLALMILFFSLLDPKFMLDELLYIVFIMLGFLCGSCMDYYRGKKIGA